MEAGWGPLVASLGTKVLCIRNFETEEEAIALANNTVDGLDGLDWCDQGAC